MSQESIKDVQYHQKKSLVLRPMINGAQVWSVALEKTMFTYFEIEPNCYFDLHSHPSEQISMVLEGELFFLVKDRTICVRKGEVIAIPSNYPHAVFTDRIPVKVIDAWSPINEKYQFEEKCLLENECQLANCPGMKP